MFTVPIFTRNVFQFKYRNLLKDVPMISIPDVPPGYICCPKVSLYLDLPILPFPPPFPPSSLPPYYLPKLPFSPPSLSCVTYLPPPSWTFPSTPLTLDTPLSIYLNSYLPCPSLLSLCCYLFIPLPSPIPHTPVQFCLHAPFSIYPSSLSIIQLPLWSQGANGLGDLCWNFIQSNYRSSSGNLLIAV